MESTEINVITLLADKKAGQARLLGEYQWLHLFCVSGLEGVNYTEWTGGFVQGRGV